MEFLREHWAGMACCFALGLSLRLLWDACQTLKKARQYRDEMKEHANEAQAWYSKTQALLDMYSEEIRKFDAKFGLGGGEDEAPPKDRVN